MGGALLQLKSTGNENIYLNGNPSKTFFKGSYAKYTNFAVQKFRIDYFGSTSLNLNEPSLYKFKIPRYGELFMDTYLSIKLPHIWSPLIGYQTVSTTIWESYDFKWIKNLGSQIIKNAHFYIGGVLIQKFSGEYLYNLIERDFDEGKKKEYYKMTGNIKELNDPANAFDRINTYPTAFRPNDNNISPYGQEKYKGGCEPSIRGRYIYIPLNIWSTLASKMAIPLVSMQYSELEIQIELKPVKEWFVVKNIDTNYMKNFDPTGEVSQNDTYYHQIDPVNSFYGFWKFLQSPPEASGDVDDFIQGIYPNKRTDWDNDIHLISSYVFLDEDEQRVFAAKPQEYLVKEVHEYNFYNITGSRRLELDSTKGLVSSWMWFFRRSDANLRNEWSNYTNWPYDFLPYNVMRYPDDGLYYKSVANSNELEGMYIPDISISVKELATSTRYNHTSFVNEYRFTTGHYRIENQKEIMSTWALLFDGKYRENTQNDGVFSYIEKYNCSKGNSPDGVYNYNFCLDTNPYNFQPSGACNLSKFHRVEFEINLYSPPMDQEAKTYTICDGNVMIGVNKPTWRLYEYNYDMVIFEERYNIIKFESGSVKLVFPR